MTTISPTRVSMYDFLYQDTQPMLSLLADAAGLSLPQARLAMSASLQAIVAALLAYQQHYEGQALSKKLFNRSAVKDLRKYNSMNLVTIKATLYYRHDTADAVFYDKARVIKASEYIAKQVDANALKVQILLSTLCVIVLRELAILNDYSKLDIQELDKWFALQPQFLAKQRFAADGSKDSSTDDNLNIAPPAFDTYWYELTQFKPEQVAPVQDMQQATSNYLKAIGRSSENAQQGHANDVLEFAPMPAIALPHQRWLLQLAKISDIYLSRNRLRISSEPDKPPTAPLVSFRLSGADDDTPVTTSEKPIEYDKPRPLWRDPVILIVFLVIGILAALSFLKYQSQVSDNEAASSEVSADAAQNQDEARVQQDVAIVKVDEADTE